MVITGEAQTGPLEYMDNADPHIATAACYDGSGTGWTTVASRKPC